ncbi:MAG: adenylyltransferase/cytidyltransferase family protein [Patescibacteria group bacterium]|nr:adenylyltransferase/cytidyltransferase family protein [Patescibacteria group bacterium]
MNKILTVEQSIDISKGLKQKGKTIVLVGGCFDILHIGHVRFLNEAKKQGDFLFIILESDEKICNIKGENRPINNQEDRAEILSNLKMTDYIIKIPLLKSDNDYRDLIILLKPDIIATTKGDPKRNLKEKHAKAIGAEVVDVIEKIEDQSTTKIAKYI